MGALPAHDLHHLLPFSSFSYIFFSSCLFLAQCAVFLASMHIGQCLIFLGFLFLIRFHSRV